MGPFVANLVSRIACCSVGAEWKVDAVEYKSNEFVTAGLAQEELVMVDEVPTGSVWRSVLDRAW